eukprot:scaffold1187_cov258-Pinguiococcus_pyrenoidosus.AAC.1
MLRTFTLCLVVDGRPKARRPILLRLQRDGASVHARRPCPWRLRPSAPLRRLFWAGQFPVDSRAQLRCARPRPT